jgi:DNA polymerase-3 subunit epsilon
MDFVAIDFETANHRPNSACQLAAVVVSGSQIVEEKCWLIRPPSNYFSKFNIAVHGIRPADVVTAPKMDAVWPEFESMLRERVLIAHNARFDVSVLLASLAHYEIACQNFDFHCTRALAKAAWPGRSRYGLKPLGSWLGIQFKHHDALEDARCCAQIALTIESQCGALQPLEALEKTLGIRRGRHRDGAVVSPKRNGQPVDSSRIVRNDRFGFPVSNELRPLGSVCVDTVRQSCDNKPLQGKNIVMLGPLRGLSMEETIKLLNDLGAVVQSQVATSTHYVVTPGIGVTDAQRQVEQATAGQSDQGDQAPKSVVRVLSERQFRALLPGGAISIG